MSEITLHNHHFILLPQRAVYWKNTQTLILADVHLGKSGHFRKAGIAVPQEVNETNLKRMGMLVKAFSPKRLFILGDLFHSNVNREWFRFEEWRELNDLVECHLITGNHDILHSSFYDKVKLYTHEVYTEAGFRFTHHPLHNETGDSTFTFCGHIHPGVRLKAPGRQSLNLPCFYQKENQMIVPAFGEFTGLFLLNIRDALGVFAIAGNRVFTL